MYIDLGIRMQECIKVEMLHIETCNLKSFDIRNFLSSYRVLPKTVISTVRRQRR